MEVSGAIASFCHRNIVVDPMVLTWDRYRTENVVFVHAFGCLYNSVRSCLPMAAEIACVCFVGLSATSALCVFLVPRGACRWQLDVGGATSVSMCTSLVRGRTNVRRAILVCDACSGSMLRNDMNYTAFLS